MQAIANALSALPDGDSRYRVHCGGRRNTSIGERVPTVVTSIPAVAPVVAEPVGVETSRRGDGAAPSEPCNPENAGVALRGATRRPSAAARTHQRCWSSRQLENFRRLQEARPRLAERVIPTSRLSVPARPASRPPSSRGVVNPSLRRAARRRNEAGRQNPRQRRHALQRHQHGRHRGRLLGREIDDRPPDSRGVSRCPKRSRSSRSIGVRLHEEPGGKLFPDTNRARDVLDALLREIEPRRRAALAEHRVLDVASRSGTASDLDITRGGPRATRSCSQRAVCRCPKRAATAPASRSRASSATRSWRRRRRSRR